MAHGKFRINMSRILDELGIDKDDLVWTDLAACQNLPTNNFFETYETDTILAKSIDDMCLVCPVAKQCLEAGMENDEYGVWGGVYLSLGTPDKTRNAHKTPEYWKKWKAKHG